MRIAMIVALFISLPAWGQGGDFSTNLHPTDKQKVPEGVIIVKGAWAGSSDTVTPVPEGAKVANHVFTDDYFGITYPLPQGWQEKHTGPPPSDSGLYTLTLITPSPTLKDTRGSISIMAQDMFFTPLPVANAEQLVKYKRKTLPAALYKAELNPSETTIAGHTFDFFAYMSPAAQLHWYVLATQIRCHAVQFVLTSSDPKLLESLVLNLNNMKLPAEADSKAGNGGGTAPVCVKDYASAENVIERVDPVFTQRRYNSVPVRVIIDRRGKVKHIHCLSAFPEQEKAIYDALNKWKFRPYVVAGKPVEVETGILFGRQPTSLIPSVKTAGGETN